MNYISRSISELVLLGQFIVLNGMDQLVLYHGYINIDCLCVYSRFLCIKHVGIFPAPVYTPAVQTIPVDNDINNTTIFIGNLDPNVTEEELRQIFLQLGEIVYVKIPATKGCGFMQFVASICR